MTAIVIIRDVLIGVFIAFCFSWFFWAVLGLASWLLSSTSLYRFFRKYDTFLGKLYTGKLFRKGGLW